MKSLRIVLCLQELGPLRRMLDGEPVSDGTYIVQGHTVAGLRARGHHLTCVAPRDLKDVEFAADLEAPRTVRRTWSAGRWFDLSSRVAWRGQRLMGMPYLNVFSNYRHLDAYLQCFRGHDVVYERNALYSLAVAKACRRLGLPYVMFFEADQLLEQEFLGTPVTGLLRRRARHVLHYNLRAADCIVCVSEPTKARLTSVWNVPPGKVVVCSNGVDVRRFSPDPVTRARVRATLGVGENPVIMFVGSFFEWHDIATLLDAFAVLHERRPDARLVLVGDGRQREAMIRRAAALGIGSAATFTGLVSHDEVAGMMCAADVAAAVYPRLQQDLWLSPLKLFEYMASGASIVASSTGQVADVVSHGRNGLLVPPGDTAALAAAIGRLVDDPDLRCRLADRARRDAVEQHSWERYVERLEGVFEEAIARRHAAARSVGGHTSTAPHRET